MRLWDTCAISGVLSDPGLSVKFGAAMINAEVRIAAPTVLELTAGTPTDEQKLVVASLIAMPGLVELPQVEDYRRAGEWLGLLPPRTVAKKRCQSCNAEVKLGKGEKRDARFRDTMDALLASVAWSRSLAVVTYNEDDFTQFQVMAGGAAIQKPEDIL